MENVSDEQTQENVQVENVPEVLDNQTSKAAGYKNQSHNNAQIPIPLLYPCPTEPQTLLRLIVHLQQHLHFLLEELWKTTPCLPEGIEKRTFLKENYECCLTQLHLYVKIRLLKDLEEIAKLPKCPEYQTNKAKSETRSEESELGHNAVQEYLMKLSNEMHKTNL